MPGDDRDEFRACSRKRRYATSVEAKKAAERSSKKPGSPKIFVYQCPYCDGWHLTHRKPK